MGESREQVQALEKYVREVYEGLGYDFYPFKTYVLVRVIPKHSEKEIRGPGGRILKLVTPEKQNKPNWEGQVLRVYKPWTDYASYHCEHCGETVGRTIVHESSLKEGDHIVFPHFTMVPVPELCLYSYWKNGNYGIVEEKAIMGTCEYPEASDEEKLKDYLKKYVGDRFTLERATRGLMELATVIFGRTPKTTSGK